jgi:hypothetical protein
MQMLANNHVGKQGIGKKGERAAPNPSNMIGGHVFDFDWWRHTSKHQETKNDT